MFKFSERSLQNLNSVDNRLKKLAEEVLKISPIDFSITCGWRTQQEQMRLYAEHKSKCDGIKIKSKHQLGLAIDIMSWKEEFIEEPKDIYILVGLFVAKAKELNIKIRTGALWNNDTTIYNTFKDPYHIEIVE